MIILDKCIALADEFPEDIHPLGFGQIYCHASLIVQSGIRMRIAIPRPLTWLPVGVTTGHRWHIVNKQLRRVKEYAPGHRWEVLAGLHSDRFGTHMRKQLHCPRTSPDYYNSRHSDAL